MKTAAYLVSFQIMCFAQESRPLAIVDSGYSGRAQILPVAPGQILTIRLAGFSPINPALFSFRAIATGTDTITSLEGFEAKVEIVPTAKPDDAKVVSVPVLMVEQTGTCYPTYSQGPIVNPDSACWVTFLTLQIPFEIPGWDSNSRVTLLVTNGVTIARGAIQAFASNIHILNSCDLASFLYEATGFGYCVPDIRSSDGQRIVTIYERRNPAKPCQIVTMRAYGLFGYFSSRDGLTGRRPSEPIAITDARFAIDYRWGITDTGEPSQTRRARWCPRAWNSPQEKSVCIWSSFAFQVPRQAWLDAKPCLEQTWH